jgi:hypothetical protein
LDVSGFINLLQDLFPAPKVPHPEKRDRTADCHVLQSDGIDHIIGIEQEKYARICTEIKLPVFWSSISNFKRFFGVHRAK